MSTIMPQSELLRKAVAYVDETIKASCGDAHAILDEAAMRFNLGPKDAEFLRKFFLENQDSANPADDDNA